MALVQLNPLKTTLLPNFSTGRALWLAGIFAFMYACMPYREEQLTDIRQDIQDNTLQRIHDFQDQFVLDSLFKYLKHPDPSYRYAAAMAFASIKDSTAIDNLAPLLQDPLQRVRQAAAYALGQTGTLRALPALIRAFDQYDTLGQFQLSNAAILEAVGRCGTANQLELLANIHSYTANDTLLLEGQAWGIYRFGLRQIVSPAGTRKMLELLQSDIPERTRWIAAHYMARANVGLDSLAAPLVKALDQTNGYHTKLPLILALSKTRQPEVLPALMKHYQSDTDYRVKCAVLRAVGNLPYPDVQPFVLQALSDPNLHIAKSAAQFFVDFGTPEDATMYWRLSKEQSQWPIAIMMYTAAQKYLPVYYANYRDAINYELRRRFELAMDPYEKAAALRAMGEYGWNARYIREAGFPSSVPVVRVAAVEALALIGGQQDFDRFFGLSARRMTREIAGYFTEAIQTGDAGMMAVAAIALRDPQRDFRSGLDSLSFLDSALVKLVMPQEVETYQEIVRPIDYFRGTTTTLTKPVSNPPIAWKELFNLPVAPKAEFQTAKGNFEVTLWMDQAPGTVINFSNLAKSGFYNGKNFHRIATNFVAQGGCPRGDGYGSLNYTIRSELPLLRYDDVGYIGMASDGNPTECTQFFFTLAPAPHLDGNYTIFGKVTQGAEVLHQLHLGDRIERVVIR